MAWRIQDRVIRGEIDNRERGIVRGKLWLWGREKPIELILQGNCHRDVAGAHLCFENTEVKDEGPPLDDFAVEQRGRVGDMTASRKVKNLLCDVSEIAAYRERGEELPFRWGNGLYLEWFSERNGRVDIEGTRYRSRIEDRAWEMSEAEEQQQAIENHGALRGFVDELGGAAPVPEGRDMTEFEWEQFFRHGDALDEEFQQAIDTYEHLPEPEREAAIGRAMGWRSPEPLSPEEVAHIDELNRICEEALNEPEPEPIPSLEGTDWVRSEDGDVHHPLQRRVFHGSIALRARWRNRGLLSEHYEEPIMELVSDYQILGSKLAGALNHLGACREARPSHCPPVAAQSQSAPISTARQTSALCSPLATACEATGGNASTNS